MSYRPDVVCPHCKKEQPYNLDGWSFWGYPVTKCCSCRKQWEVKREEFFETKCSKRSNRGNLEDFTTEELEQELYTRRRSEFWKRKT